MHNISKIIFPPLHKEGYLFVGLFILGTFILYSFSTFLGFIAFLLTIWCFYFFRNPVRIVPDIKGAIICPADGMIQQVRKVNWPKELKYRPENLKKNDKVWCISIFMNVFNVHVNRVPVAGSIKEVVYVPGKFLNASLDKASEYNERQIFIIEDKETKRLIAFTQIAGLVARRITRSTKKGDQFSKGETFGMIRFGSRVDVFLPLDVVPQVCEGQISIAGETILANLSQQREKPVAGILQE